MSAILGGITWTQMTGSLANGARSDEAGEGRIAKVAVSKAREWLARKDVVFVDARAGSEFRNGHIPGATSVNAENFDAALARSILWFSAPRSLVVYCGDSGCDLSREVAGRLTDLGLGPIFILEGGWQAWKAAGLPLERP